VTATSPPHPAGVRGRSGLLDPFRHRPRRRRIDQLVTEGCRYSVVQKIAGPTGPDRATDGPAARDEGNGLSSGPGWRSEDHPSSGLAWEDERGA
jgi:hypothetical protein